MNRITLSRSKREIIKFLCFVLAVLLLISAVGCSPVSDERKESVPDEPMLPSTSIEITSNLPAIHIHGDNIQDQMAEIEANEAYPADCYIIEINGLSVPVKLYMHLDCVTAIEAYGQYVELTEVRDIYGNCSFSLFEADDAIILEGGYYSIGDIYILSAEKHSELHPGKEASYWLSLDDNGSLMYHLTHNYIASICQTGALSVAVGYDEFLRSEGKASIVAGEVIFDEPNQSYTMSDVYDLDKEFAQLWSNDYQNIEDKFASNRLAREAYQ